MSLNKYMKINRLEFLVTNSCTSRCRHCSVGNTANRTTASIDKEVAVSVVTELAKQYDINSVMTFGGEPLMYADTTCAIHEAATSRGILKRQIITNGFFTNDNARILSVAKALKESGVNSLLLSVDAFHQEHISLEKVYFFAKAVCNEHIEGLKLHPAWVADRSNENKYNLETEKCLKYFADLEIPVSEGNSIFPAGNAIVYLSEFFEKKLVDLGMKCGELPYTDRLDDIKTIAVSSNGDVVACCFTIGNVYNESITEIINRYDPYKNPMMKALIDGGIGELVKLAENNGMTIDISQYYSACGVCRDIVKKLSPVLHS